MFENLRISDRAIISAPSRAALVTTPRTVRHCDGLSKTEGLPTDEHIGDDPLKLEKGNIMDEDVENAANAMVVIYETLSNTQEPQPETGTDLASLGEFIRSLPEYYVFSGRSRLHSISLSIIPPFPWHGLHIDCFPHSVPFHARRPDRVFTLFSR
jgi:hypothetical protein